MYVRSTVALLGSLAAMANAHGTVQGIDAADVYYTGYSPSFQYQTPSPVVIGWSVPSDLSNGYVNDYTSPDIICHLSATPAQTHAPVAGGDKVTFDWTAWPSSHHGPVLTYLAKCDGKCEDAVKADLKWFKIDAAGLINDDTVPGTWATDNLISNNNSYTVTIPSSIASGNYVARHEIIALHSAEESGGAQNYPQCINLEVTSSGTDEPEGTLGTALYKATDPGILVNIYQSLSTYVIPGPTLYSGAVSGSATAAASSAAATSSTPASSSAVATSSAAATSAAASSAAATSSVASSSASAVTTQAAVVTSSSAAATNVVVSQTDTDIVYATTAVTVTGSAPAATATGTSSATTTPSKELPAGTTLQDLLDWIAYMFQQEKTSSKSKRSHARAFRV